MKSNKRAMQTLQPNNPITRLATLAVALVAVV